jgi:hypothetical protein
MDAIRNKAIDPNAKPAMISTTIITDVIMMTIKVRRSPERIWS